MTSLNDDVRIFSDRIAHHDFLPTSRHLDHSSTDIRPSSLFKIPHKTYTAIYTPSQTRTSVLHCTITGADHPREDLIYPRICIFYFYFCYSAIGGQHQARLCLIKPTLSGLYRFYYHCCFQLYSSYTSEGRMVQLLGGSDTVRLVPSVSGL